MRFSAINVHDQVAMLGKEFYDAPQEALAFCYDRSVLYVSGLYADLFETVLPGVEANYRQVLTATSDFAARIREYVDYLVENPERVAAESVRSITENLAVMGNASVELIQQLQEKTAAIVSLLLERPLQTLESTASELLTGLIDGYFELVSGLLATM